MTKDHKEQIYDKLMRKMFAKAKFNLLER
jgi:hypothetical protein